MKIPRTLPARFAGLARGFAVILVRKTLPASAAVIEARRARRFFGARFIDFQVSAADLLAIQARNGLRGFVVVGHFHERKAPGAAGLPILHQVYTTHFPERLEQGVLFTF